MNTQQLSQITLIRELRSISLQFGEPIRSRKIELLNTVLKFNNCKAKDILIFHDTLLSLLAWPENKTIFELAKKAMNQLTRTIKNIIAGNKRLERHMSGSGIAGTELTGSFSYAITRWLADEFDSDVKLDSSEASPETAKLFFHQLIPAVEYETISSGELTLLQRIKKLKGKSKISDIKWLECIIPPLPINSVVDETSLVLSTGIKTSTYLLAAMTPGHILRKL